MKHLLHFLVLFFAFSIYASENTITTSSGKVSAQNKNGVLFFEDIPYAQPPVGYLRWKAPREIKSNETLIKSKKDNFCVQRPSNLGGIDSEGDFVGTEDCLYLDIHKPKKHTEKLPVMFWIHGGGNTSGYKDIYDFSKMVKKHNVIVVRINYRLGPFGWFYHPSLQGLQNGIDKTSNFGTLDIISALKWVNQNIHLFGGDSENITIFGESAGGHNVLSLLVSQKANGLFHKAISMSGYTTTINQEKAYKQDKQSSTSDFSSWNVMDMILEDNNQSRIQESYSDTELRDILLTLSTKDFFKHYSNREPYQELPLLQSDGIVIPKQGLRNALSNPKHIKQIPIIAGSTKDEVKLWLASARYFVDLDYSILGTVFRIPKVILKDEDAFSAFNYYRSSAWKIRGVDNPLKSIAKAGNSNLYAYRYDWDDHRQFLIADFKKLIGAAHATEIPLLAGDYKLVGGYPLSDLIYPPSVSKRFTSKNMMQYWTNFAKYGEPGESTNSVKWEPYDINKNRNGKFLVIDKKKYMKMSFDSNTFETLMDELYLDIRLTELEKCVVLLQMLTFVGNDLYKEKSGSYKGSCQRSASEKFLIDNASFIEY
ncbi:MAG: hypothetical protein CMD75_00855 [Gammaproteobacteria bacterium]|nr:hypothetical protein [Gammaproteobacteria bacterium]|tara:strand:- start:3596 stop:5380 length:1785 start_codon:yes stop_codon:yes gene_type:complete